MPKFGCISCDCYVPFFPEEPRKGGVCHGRPPSPHIIQLKQKIANGPIEPVTTNLYASVGPDDWCLKHPKFAAWRASLANGAAEPEPLVAFVVPLLGPTEDVKDQADV